MQLTKGAIGNLINRYKAVLKKCHLMNTFGSLAVAGMLVMGGAGVAGAADDVALEGKNTYDSAETPTVNHLMGGWLVNTPETAGNAKGDITLTVNGGTISEIIGGSYAQGLTAENNELLTVTHGNITTTTISGEKTTSAEFVVGGSKVAGGDGANLETGKTTLTITGGTFGTQKTDDYELVMGGNYAKTAGNNKLTATTEGSSVAVNDGTFHASVVGGSVAHNYSGNGSITVTDNGATSVTINGGTFNPSESNLADSNGGINLKAAVIGGGLAYGANTSTVLGSDAQDVTSSVSISGDAQVNGKVVAGSVVANGGYSAIVHGDTLLSMSGGTVSDDLVGGGMVQDAAPLSGEKPESNLIVTGDAGVTVAGGTAKGEIVGGNYVRGNGSARVENSAVSITGGTFALATDSQNKAQYVIGGNKSMAYAGDTAKTLVEKNSGVLVSGDVTIADGAVVGGSMAKATSTGQATATVADNSAVQVDKGTLAGVVGGGLAETYSHADGGAATSSVGGTSSVTINGGTINGIAYGAVADNAGTSSAAIVGGGLANGAGSSASVTNTSVTIAGGKIDGKVVAGGLAINGGTTTAGGNTLLTMTDGAVSGDLIGGNLLEKDGKEGSDIAGSTVNVKGGTVAGEIYGGSYVRNTAATSKVDNTTVNISSGTIGAKVPQGWAQYVVGDGKAMSDNTATQSDVTNTATVNISGGNITRGAVVGGGFARAQGAGGSATANVKDSVVNLTGGTLVGVVGGGLAENLGAAGSSATATAGVTTASLTIDGNATVSDIIYKGNDGEGTPSSAAVIGGGLAYNKNGSTAVASVKTASTTINGGTINGDVYAGGMADGAGAKAEVTNANLTIKGGEINGNIYAGGYALNEGQVEVGTSTVTFDGNSSFAKTVQGGNATNSTLAFTNYNGAFNGLVVGFDQLDVAEGSTLQLATLSTGEAGDDKAGVFNGKALTLTGAGNVEANTVNVVAGGGLTVQSTLTAKKLTATGDVAVDGGVLNLTGTGTATADASKVNNLKLTNGTQASIAGSLTLDGANKTLTVGTGDDTVGGTTLSAKHINLNDGMLLVDPAWGLASSNVAVESMGTAPATDDVIVNGRVGVGQNSYLALGTADTGWLPGVVGNYTKGVGLSKDGITAALGVFKGITIADGKALVVNGGLMDTATSTALTGAVTGAAANSATFAANSLLVVNGAKIYGDKAAISFAAQAGGTLTVDKTSRLVVTDAVAGETYTIVDNITANTGNKDQVVWKTEGLSTTTDMISLGDAKFDGTDKVTTSATRNDAHTVFPNLSDGMANAVNDLYTGHAGAAGQPNWDYADVNSDQMGVRFLSRATDNRFLGMDKNAAAESIESAARIAFAGAAPQMTRMASDAGTNAVVNRLGFADPADGAQAMDAEGKIVDRNTTGFALWIAPLWQSQHGWGLDAGNMDYGFNGNLGGVSLGADYTFENAIRAGITFNIGGGYAESSGGDLSSTENRMNFWGLGAYAGWNYENFGVMADVSYTSTWNQLKQDLDSRLGMGNKLEADVQASAISAGLRAEYLLQTSAMDIIPHIGVRYMSLNTWGYDVDTHGGTVLEGDSLHQDIWTFPIGVTFSKDFALDSGWSFKPSLDFSVIPAAGDIKAKHDVHFTGLPGSYEVETQMMDYLTWQGGVGLELANDNMSIGVNYTLQAGQHTTGHGVFGSFRYEF